MITLERSINIKCTDGNGVNMSLLPAQNHHEAAIRMLEIYAKMMRDSGADSRMTAIRTIRAAFDCSIGGARAFVDCAG